MITNNSCYSLCSLFYLINIYGFIKWLKYVVHFSSISFIPLHRFRLILLRMSHPLFCILCNFIHFLIFLHNSSYGCWQVCLYTCIQLLRVLLAQSFSWSFGFRWWWCTPSIAWYWSLKHSSAFKVTWKCWNEMYWITE